MDKLVKVFFIGDITVTICKMSSLHPSFVPSLVEVCSLVLEKKMFKFGQCIVAILLLSPLEKNAETSFEENLNFFFTNVFFQFWLKFALCLWRNFFKYFKDIIAISILSPFGKKDVVLHLNKL